MEGYAGASLRRGAVASCAITTFLTCGPAAAQSSDINILFVGNSFTHGRYDPALNYNAGPANSSGDGLVHDLLCPSLTASGACSSGAGAVAPVIPTSANTPGGNLAGPASDHRHSNPAFVEIALGAAERTGGLEEIRIDASFMMRPVIAREEDDRAVVERESLELVEQAADVPV